MKIAYVVDAASPYRITSFQLRNVPKTFRFVSGGAVTADDVEDLEAVTESLEEVYTYIVPENLQGVDETITNAKDKKTDKPATYVEIKGAYEDKSIATTFESSYRMYLGENNTNDFNLLRNKLYSFVGNLRLEDGDDHRVTTEEIPAPYEQPESNCYMLTPDAEHALAIPVSRVNVFWSAVDSRYELNDGENDSKIQKWVVKVIWQDVEGEIVKFEQAEGVRADEKFVVAPAGTGIEGNVVVGIYDATGGKDIDVKTASPLWSWHIWVTKYNPGDQGWVPMPAYSAEGMMDSSDNWAKRAAYNVPGGKIYQHNSCQQSSTAKAVVDYAMMDRNLGALSSNKAEFEKTVGFYYQWGRKDPFYAPEGNLSGIDLSTNSAQDVSFTVLNPTKYIASGSNDWCAPQNDQLWSTSSSSYSAEKTIYDPCPVGWRMPFTDVFQPMTVGVGYTMGGIYKPYVSRSKALSGTTAKDLADAFNRGYLFWPDDLQAWFPAAGAINAYGTKVNDYGCIGRWWTWHTSNKQGVGYQMLRYDQYEDEEAGYEMFLSTNTFAANQNRANALTVRCVMEKK